VLVPERKKEFLSWGGKTSARSFSEKPVESSTWGPLRAAFSEEEKEEKSLPGAMLDGNLHYEGQTSGVETGPNRNATNRESSPRPTHPPFLEKRGESPRFWSGDCAGDEGNHPKNEGQKKEEGSWEGKCSSRHEGKKPRDPESRDPGWEESGGGRGFGGARER